MNDGKWRFPKSNHGQTHGISTGDSEAFRNSPYSAFAREMLQNSIDARNSDEEPVSVIIKEFSIKKADIPGYEELRGQIIRCKDYWKDKEDYAEAYDKILAMLDSDNLPCLRVSDYNTTGLVGVETPDREGNHFIALTKSSGVSEKDNSVAGGSKGLGKNAAFLMSGINTIFYSTHTCMNLQKDPGDYYGSLGVAELVSGYVDNEHKDNDYTQGTGYFSEDDSNNAMPTLLDFDGTAQERKDNCGTDLFILGFKKEDGWEKEVVNEILDSFMVAIYRKELEVYINDIDINYDNLESVVYDDRLIDSKKRADIVSQYRLIKGGNDVFTYDIETEYGNCDLYLLPLKKDEIVFATHSCALIRHPLMKIQDLSLGKNLDISGMCIIGEGTIGEMLRKMENPQHRGWEPNRIDPSERKEYKSLLKEIREQITQRTIECLKTGSDEPLDPNGAGDYLPDVSAGENESSSNGNQKPEEKVTVSKPRVNNYSDKNPVSPNQNGSSLQPDIGENGEDGDETSYPEGENSSSTGEYHPGSASGIAEPGDNVIFKKKQVTGVRPRVISMGKGSGKLRVAFIAPNEPEINTEQFYLKIMILDDSNAATAIKILGMTQNGKVIKCDDPIEYGPFTMKAGEKVILDVDTDQTGLFGSEVKIICK